MGSPSWIWVYEDLKCFFTSFWGVFLRQNDHRNIPVTLLPFMILLNTVWKQHGSSVAWWRLLIKCQTAPTQLIRATDSRSRSHSLTFKENWNRLLKPMSAPVGGNQSNQRRPTQARGGCATSAPKSPWPPAWPNSNSNHHNNSIAIFPRMLRASEFHTDPISPVCFKLKQYKELSNLQPSGASSISRDQYYQWRGEGVHLCLPSKTAQTSRFIKYWNVDVDVLCQFWAPAVLTRVLLWSEMTR